MPSSNRPPAIRSRLDSSLASTTGLRNGKTNTPVPSLIRVVRVATAASKVSEFEDWERRIDPEKDMVPHPDRIEPQLFGFGSIGDQRLRIRHFRKGREVPHRQAKGVREDRHHDTPQAV